MLRMYHHLNMIEVFQSKYLEVVQCCAYASKSLQWPSPYLISCRFYPQLTQFIWRCFALHGPWEKLTKADKGQQKWTSDCNIEILQHGKWGKQYTWIHISSLDTHNIPQCVENSQVTVGKMDMCAHPEVWVYKKPWRHPDGHQNKTRGLLGHWVTCNKN